MRSRTLPPIERSAAHRRNGTIMSEKAQRRLHLIYGSILSALIVAVILVILLAVNFAGSARGRKDRKGGRS